MAAAQKRHFPGRVSFGWAFVDVVRVFAGGGAIVGVSDSTDVEPLAFFSVALVGAAISLEPLASGDDPIPVGQVLTGLGITVVGGLGLSVTGLVIWSSSDHEREVAFAGYEPSLRLGLSLCEKGDKIVPCQ